MKKRKGPHALEFERRGQAEQQHESRARKERVRRERAITKAHAALENARRERDERSSTIEAERATREAAETRGEALEALRKKLEAALRALHGPLHKPRDLAAGSMEPSASERS
jgi:hypothetical protein